MGRSTHRVSEPLRPLGRDVVSITLIPPVPGERIGIRQNGRYLSVLSKCCAAQLDDRQINKDGIKCSACDEREPLRKIPDSHGNERLLGRFIQLSSDPDNSTSVRWWLRGWTGLECEVEMDW